MIFKFLSKRVAKTRNGKGKLSAKEFAALSHKHSPKAMLKLR